MPIYSFSAIDTSNNKISEGKLEAANPQEAKAKLRADGKMPTKLEEDQGSIDMEKALSNLPLIGPIFSPRVGLKEVNIMTQQLSTLIDAGIPLIEALYMLEQQAGSKRMKHIMKTVRNQVIAGDSFSKSLSRFPDFSRLYVNMMKAGEVSGELDRICQRLSVLIEKNMHLTGAIQSAMTYPAVTLVIILGVCAVVLTFVVPKFKTMFASFGSKLPAPTEMLMNMSDFLMNFWWVIIPTLVVSILWAVSFARGAGKPLFDQWILTVPMMGSVFRKVYVSRFVRTLSTVVASGVPLTEGLVTAADTIDNYVIRTALEKARDNILMGGGLARPLETTGAFPLMVTKMIAIGEETGKLETMLNKSADYMDAEVDNAIEALTTIIEPIMIVVMGCILMFVALALYLPMFELPNLMAGGG